ncbi:MAG TPA: hypothetical protein VGK14_09700 [Novimethylophilus sp.]|jgi:hypothetical protein|uniref:hypothetical protein n=1 Tax=Novimethylophilus sp. TaxID=2137426 RepID=UPI002F42FC9A
MNVVPRILLLAGIGHLVLFSPTVAAEPLKRLSAAEIKSRIIGMVITDEAHWSDEFLPDGILNSMQLGQKKPGTWKLVGRELCLTHKSRKETTTDCCEIWLWKDQVEYHRNGVVAAEAWLRPPP